MKNEYCCGNESALFFSGGVDAFSTLIAHVKENPLFITLWGADIRHEDIVGWEHVARHVKETALKWGKNYTFAKTNFRYILNERLLNDLVRKSGYGYWYGFQHGIGIISHAAPLAYTHQIPLVYIASSYTKGGEIACASSPMIDNYVRMGMCRVANDQSDWTRQDKIRNICEYVRQTHGEVQLRVCWESSGGGNCCRCEKCSRTIFGILAEGENPLDYGFTYTSADFANICDNIRRHWIFSKVYIELWKDIQKRFVSNRTRIPYNKDLEWIYTYDFDKVNDNFRKRLLCLNQSIRKKLSPLKHYLFKCYISATFVSGYLDGIAMNKANALYVQDGNLDTVTIRLPKVDLKLLKALAKKMGWSVATSARKSGYESAMDDIRAGRVTEHASVEEYFREILK